MPLFELGLIGCPLGHSRSAEYFNRKFERENIPGQYLNMPLESIGELPGAIAARPSLIGFNVTAPYKKEVIPYLSRLSREAEEVGAVNTVRILRNGNGMELVGYNTDVAGFRESIRPMLSPSRSHRALVMGSGGAALAVRRGLGDMGIESLVVSRRRGADRICYEELDSDIMTTCDIIVNATPLGTFPSIDSAPPLDYSLLTPAHICFDLVYNPTLTLFLRKALKRGAVIRNGLQMLRLQAEAAYRIWTTGDTN